MELISTEYTQNYTSFKQELDTELNKAADGFVKIGYLLRQAEDTDVLASSGYSNVTEFALAEYGLTKDIVSRYININKRFSEGGYSDRLADRYQNYGLAKLAEMLTLPAEIVEQIPDTLSKAEIREIKKEYDEEQKISDIEVAIEQAAVEHSNEEPAEHFQKILYEHLKLNPDDFMKVSHLKSWYQIENIYEALAPSGTRVIIARIPGTGKLMMTINSMEKAPEITNMRTGETEVIPWDKISEYLYEICGVIDEPADRKQLYRDVYGEELPEPEPQEDKPDAPEPVKKRKESKVTVAKPKKAEVAPVQHTEIVENTECEPDEYKEVVSQDNENKEIVTGEVEGDVREVEESTSDYEIIENTETVQQLVAEEPVMESPFKDMPTEKIEEIFGELYNSMDENYQMAKRYLRQYNYEAAEQAMKEANKTFEKLIPYTIELYAREDEDNV